MQNKFKMILGVLFVLCFFTGNLQAQDSTAKKDTKQNHGQFFIDKNGDGYNDNAPDHDMDGIPNGLDPDWQKLKKMKAKKKQRYIDLDGDGVDDNIANENQKNPKQEKIVNDNGPLMDEKGKKNVRRQKRSGKN